MAILHRVRLKNFGCFPELDVELSPLTVLVGPNDSGKSTFLKGVMAHKAFIEAEEKHEGDVGAALGMPNVMWSGASG